MCKLTLQFTCRNQQNMVKQYPPININDLKKKKLASIKKGRVSYDFSGMKNLSVSSISLCYVFCLLCGRVNFLSWTRSNLI